MKGFLNYYSITKLNIANYKKEIKDTIKLSFVIVLVQFYLFELAEVVTESPPALLRLLSSNIALAGRGGLVLILWTPLRVTGSVGRSHCVVLLNIFLKIIAKNYAILAGVILYSNWYIIQSNNYTL